MVVVRFAPSPTGYLHIGGARTAIFNWLFARQKQGKFLLRIEDTDRERSGSEMVEAIIGGLQWLGLDWDGEPVYQSQRLPTYQRYVAQLVENGKAYRCFCSAERIADEREKAIAAGEQFKYSGRCRHLSAHDIEKKIAANAKFTVRFKLPEGKIRFHDVLHGDIEIEEQILDDFIILRSDGYPTYHLAVVVDDFAMGVTHVIRGDDHLSNTPKQVLLYIAFGWQIPEFVHVPLIHGADRRRMSKRHGATAVGEYRDFGYMPAAMVNYLALLGWSPGDDRELFTQDELVTAFDLDGLSKSSAIFDEKKLLWLNGQHIWRLTGEALFTIVGPLLTKAGLLADDELARQKEFLIRVLELTKTRVKLLGEFVEHVRYLFIDPVEFDSEAEAKFWCDAAVGEMLRTLREQLTKVSRWAAGDIEKVIRDYAEKLGVSAAKVIHPVRLALTGRAASPGLFEIMALIGRDTVLRRLQKAADMIMAKA